MKEKRFNPNQFLLAAARKITKFLLKNGPIRRNLFHPFNTETGFLDFFLVEIEATNEFIFWIWQLKSIMMYEKIQRELMPLHLVVWGDYALQVISSELTAFLVERLTFLS